MKTYSLTRTSSANHVVAPHGLSRRSSRSAKADGGGCRAQRSRLQSCSILLRKALMWVLMLGLAGVAAGPAEGRSAREQVRAMNLPRVEYRDARISDAFEQLADAARGADPDEVGINIVYRGPTGEAAPRITMSLRRVSLYDAIRYLTQVAGLYYRIDDNAVIISDEPFRPDQIITRMYPVQPTFMDVIRGGQEQEEEPRERFFW